MDNQNVVYVSYDSDNAGRKIGRAILADRPDQLKDASDRIELGNEVIAKWAMEHDGVDYSSGGDQGVGAVPPEAAEHLEQVKSDYQFATGLTVTMGVGKTLSESGKALLVGKFRGKNVVVYYTPEIEQEIKQAEAHLAEGTASEEERKLGEAYLQNEGTVSAMANQNKFEENTSNDSIPEHDNCQYCTEMASSNTEDPNHCKYCHGIESDTECQYCNDMHDPMADGHSEDCQYCAEMNHDPTVAGHPDDCQYCVEMGSSAQPVEGNQVVTGDPELPIKNPTTTDSENYAGQDLNEPDLPKPDAIQTNPDGLAVDQDVPTNENIKLTVQGQGSHDPNITQETPDADPQGEETVQSIAEQIEEEPVNINPQSQAVNQIDAADIPTGDAMEGNISRPEDFDSKNTPKEMGLTEENENEPDITGVMREGLDSHAENIQRERVVNLVSEALVGFKSCKDILEKAKEQAPQLYESSIAMVKAMIEMAKMLGLEKENETSDGENPLESGQSNNSADSGHAAGSAVGAAGGVPKAPKQKGLSANQ